MNPYSLRKTLRALEIARLNRLPVVNLVESGGADLPTQARPLRARRPDLPRAHRAVRAGHPDGRARVRQLHGGRRVRAGHVRLLGARGRSRPRCSSAARRWSRWPPARTPTTRRSAAPTCTPASPGSATTSPSTSTTRSGSAAPSSPGSTGASSGRRRGRSVDRRSTTPTRSSASLPPDPKVPFDPREVLARTVDGSEFDEYKPRYGTSLVTGWASVHGFPVGVLANHRGVLFSEEAQARPPSSSCWPTRPTPRWSSCRTPPATWSAPSYEQGGIIKDGAKMINAVTNSAVPHLTINMARSFGAGNYGMSGRAYDPRLMFAWPGAKLAVMGAAQLAGVMSIVGQASAAAPGRPFDEDADAARTAAIEAQIETESHAFSVTARLYDDGIIDPRDTRTVLGHGACRPSTRPPSPAGAASASSGCEPMITEAPGRQPRGDRRAGVPHRARPGHRHRRRVTPTRTPTCRIVALADEAVRLPGSRPRRHLPARRRAHRRGPGDRRRRGAPRLRVPLGERGLRARLRRGGADVRRAVARTRSRRWAPRSGPRS